MSSRGEAVDRNLERDTVELLLETPELPPERREALARELEAVVARHLPGRPLRLLSGVDERGVFRALRPREGPGGRGARGNTDPRPFRPLRGA